MKSGLVTVIICVYNAGEHLRSSVESILTQTYANLEVIVVDDGSTDGCIATISDIDDRRMRILRQQNGGKPAALNHALSEMVGEFYAVHDADDLSHRRRLERQVQCMRDNPEIAGVFCGFELIIEGRHVAPTFSEKTREECLRDINEMQMPGHDPTAMYRVSLVKDFRYDERLPVVEGYDYVLRIGEAYPMHVVGECLYAYRIHWNTVTKRNPAIRQQLLRSALEKVLERRGLPYDEKKLPAAVDPDAARNRDQDNDIVSHFMASMVDLRHAGRHGEALRNAVTCAMLHPLDYYYYKPTIYAVAPLAVIDWYRARKGTH